MKKSDFLLEISSLSREDIQKRLLDNNQIKRKTFCPVSKTSIKKKREEDKK